MWMSPKMLSNIFEATIVLVKRWWKEDVNWDMRDDTIRNTVAFIWELVYGIIKYILYHCVSFSSVSQT